MYYLTNLLFYDIQLLYYYINLISLIIFCLCPGDIHISINSSSVFEKASELFCDELIVILFAILLTTKSPVVFTEFLNYSF